MKITNRTDVSLLTTLLQYMLRPIGHKLASSTKRHPAGSPRLTPNAKARKRCDIRERQVSGIWIYDMSAKLTPSETATNDKQQTHTRRKRIYYFAGGTWQQPPSPEHWKLCAEMCNKIPNLVISLISPPLAPTNPAPETFPQLLELYHELMSLNRSNEDPELITWAGDSSGGNIALCLVLAALSDPTSANRSEAPDSVFVMSPSVECTAMDPSDPLVKLAQKVDPILRLPASNEGAAMWAGDWDLADPRLTPLNADVGVLARNGVRLYGVTGAHDIRTPGARKFRDLCAQAGVQGEWLDWEGQMHCFPMAWIYGLREYKEGKEWIVEVLSQ